MTYGRMNYAHDPLTSKLPAEIVSKIFTNFLPANVASDYGIRDVRAGKVVRTTPLLLGAVCSAWRAIIWSTPLLWTSIFVNLADFEKAHIDILDEWLHRSGGLPLYIGIYGKGRSMTSIAGIAEKVMDSFAPFSHRWFYLVLKNPQDFLRYLRPKLAHAFMLNTLKIKATSLTEEINLERIPHLRNLLMDRLQVDKLLNMDWGQLRKVKVSIPSVDMCYDLFSKASFMTTITFDLLPSKNIYTTRDVVLQHNHLITLHIKHWTRPTSIVLALMEFPALRRLVVASPVVIENIISLLRRSRCTLKCLEIDLTSREMEFEPRLIPFLAEIPSLETLEFRRAVAHRNAKSDDSVDPLLAWLSKTAQTQETATSQATFLPNLKKLRIKNMELSYDRVLDVLRAHSDDPAGLMAPRFTEGYEKRQHTRPLRSLHIQVWGEEYEQIELDIAQQLQRAIEGGFEVTIVAVSHNQGLTDIIDKSLHPSET